MISGWFSGQPVAKAVTNSAEVDRCVIWTSFTNLLPGCVSGGDDDWRRTSFAVQSADGWIGQPSSARHEGRDFDLDLGPLIDQARDIEQRRRRKGLAQR